MNAEVKRIYWCECLWSIVEFDKSVERALGILNWAEGKGYEKPTGGAKEAVKDALKSMQETVTRCRFTGDVFPDYTEAQRNLMDAVGAPIKDAVNMVISARQSFRRAIGDQCIKERRMIWEEAEK